MRTEKCDHTNLRKYWDTEEENSYVSAAKREENQRGTTVETIKGPQSPNEEKGGIHRRSKQSKQIKK